MTDRMKTLKYDSREWRNIDATNIGAKPQRRGAGLIAGIKSWEVLASKLNLAGVKVPCLTAKIR